MKGRNKPTTDPIAAQIKEKRTRIHELYKIKQARDFTVPETNEVDRLSREIAELQTKRGEVVG